MSLINFNPANSGALLAYNQNLAAFTQSAERLATTLRYPTATSGGSGEVSVADQMEQQIRGTSALKISAVNALGYTQTQDAYLESVGEILQSMSEIAASALDATKTSSDRSALDAEYQALAAEISTIATTSYYNGTSLFGQAISVRMGLNAATIISLSAIDLGAFATGITTNVGTVAAASAAFSSLTGKIASLNALRTKSGTSAAQLTRAISNTQSYIDNISNAESAIRNIDVAEETGKFVQAQVALSVSQSVVGQTNQLPASVLSLLG